MSGVEQHGIEPIPDAERAASLFDFLRISWGGSNSLATAVLGAFPIIFGLSFWQGVWACVLGVSLGAAVLAPMALFGAVNGTNNAVSSSAHFGVVGRIVGSFLSLLTAIAFFSISVWSSGDALVGALKFVAGVTPSDGLYALAYAALGLAVLWVAVYGFRMMLWVTKIAVMASTVLFAVGFVAFAPQFDAGFAGSQWAWGSRAFWPAFVSATLVVLANPISFGAFLGDWTRYLPRSTSPSRLVGTAFLSQILSLPPFIFGLMTATIIARTAPAYLANVDYTGGLIATAPRAFALPLLVLALSSGMSTGTQSLYGTGLDFSSVFPRLSRVRATLLIGVIAFLLIFVGRFVFNLIDAITTFVSLIVVTTTPWMIIMMLGYWCRRGYYLPDAMQVFNRGEEGGAYWFTAGWNVPTMTVWVISSVLALAAVNMPGHFVGPLGLQLGAVDCSLVFALLVPAVLYPFALWLCPEPRAVYGPHGARIVPTVAAAIAPIRRRSTGP
jgi:purine-cytosine permease-like protein